MMFHLANAAMLPLAASLVTLRSDKLATILVAAAIVAPQFTVTVLSPLVARLADRWGRRPLLFFGFGALAIRGVLFACSPIPARSSPSSCWTACLRRRWGCWGR